MKPVFKKILILKLFFLIYAINLVFIIKLKFLIQKNYQRQKVVEELFSLKGVGEKQFSFSAGPLVLGESAKAEVKLVDGRVANLKNFFRKYNSPLYDFAEDIVRVADKYGFDYRLLPAIAMQESTLCKYIPENSFNCWGYGIYGNQVLKFSSYKEAIEVVAQGLKKNYIDKGLTTPESVMKKYTPSSPGTWAKGINYSFKLLE